MFPYIIFDDIIDKEKQDFIEDYMFSDKIHWLLARNRHLKPETNPEVTDDPTKRVALVYPIYNFQTQLDPNFNLFYEIINNACSRLNVDIAELKQIRGAMQPHIITDEKHGIPHIDFWTEDKYKICLYYVNDIDGDTVLYKQRTSNTTPEEVKAGKLDEMVKITPKKGRCVIFDGDIYHASGRPKTDFRCILNYNLRVNE